MNQPTKNSHKKTITTRTNLKIKQKASIGQWATERRHRPTQNKHFRKMKDDRYILYNSCYDSDNHSNDISNWNKSSYFIDIDMALCILNAESILFRPNVSVIYGVQHAPNTIVMNQQLITAPYDFPFMEYNNFSKRKQIRTHTLTSATLSSVMFCPRCWYESRIYLKEFILYSMN